MINNYQRNKVKGYFLLLGMALLLEDGQILAQPGSWDTEKQSMMVARYAPGSATANSTLFVIGGGVGARCGSRRSGSMESYEPDLGSWSSKASMPTARGWFGTGAINGIVLAAGGRSKTQRGISTLEAYDPLTDSWTSKTGMKHRRAAPAAGVIDGKLYVAGGFANDVGTGTLDILEVYDPLTNSWTLKESMHTGRSHAGAGVIDGKLYVLGGVSGGRDLLNSVEVYDPSTNAWNDAAAMPTARIMPGVAASGGRLYVVGGSNASSNQHPPLLLNDQFEIYDPVKDKWSNGPPLPTPRYGPAAGWIGGKFYVAGGCADTSVDILEVFTPPSIVIVDIAQGSDVPPTAMFPETAKNGDFEIVGTEKDPLAGDGADDGTLWTFDFTSHPEYANFPRSGTVISAMLTLTLIRKGADIHNDQVGIRRLGIRSATPEIHALALNEKKTVQIELANSSFYSGAAILDALVRSSGTLAMLYTDDATVESAKLELVALDSDAGF